MGWARRFGDRSEVFGDDPGDLPQAHLLVLDPDPAHVHPREVEQVGGQLRQTVDLGSRRRQKLAAGSVVQVLVGEELEEAREREERCAELVGRIGDEFLARQVELCELDPHSIERACELANLVVPVVDDRLAERSLGNAIRGLLEAPETPSMDRSDREPERDGDQEGGERREQEPSFDEGDGGELIGERAREQHHVARREQRQGHLGVLAALVVHTRPHGRHALGGRERGRILLDFGPPTADESASDRST